jgi:DNA primase
LLVAALNHAHIVDRYCEMFGAMELSSPALHQVRQLILDAGAEGLPTDVARASATARGHGALLARLEASVRARREWWAEAGAAEQDAETGFRHTLALHVKVRALHNELRSAEAALAQDPSEDHLRRVVEVQRSLRTVEGTEATIEGFGGASGRPARAL